MTLEVKSKTTLDLKPNQEALTQDEMDIFGIFRDVAEGNLSPFQGLMKLETMVEAKEKE